MDVCAYYPKIRGGIIINQLKRKIQKGDNYNTGYIACNLGVSSLGEMMRIV